MGNRKSPSEIARRENWKAMFAGAKRRGMERAPSPPASASQKAQGLIKKNSNTSARIIQTSARIIQVGVTRNPMEKPHRSRSVGVPESTKKDNPTSQGGMDTVRRVVGKLQSASLDAQSFEPFMSWPLPNGNGDCAVAHNGTVAVRYSGGEFTRIGSVGRMVGRNEKKRSVLKEVEPIYNAHLNRLRKRERKG